MSANKKDVFKEKTGLSYKDWIKMFKNNEIKPNVENIFLLLEAKFIEATE